MAEEIELAAAPTHPGLRLVSVRAIPSPWSEAAKGILHVKKLPYAWAKLTPGSYDELAAWTGQTSAPVLAWEDEKPRTGWAEILLLAERLAPGPRLVPEDPRERALLFGLAHELMGEQGFGWCRRLDGIHRAVSGDAGTGFPRDFARGFGARYGYREEEGELYRRRTREILELFVDRLRAQAKAGSDYLLGDSLSALDIYWAAMSALLEPLPEADCPMPGAMRTFYGLRDPALRPDGVDELLAHRDRIYREHLELPVRL